MRAHKRIEKVCPPPCGKTFMARATDVLRGKGGGYCSRACSAKQGWSKAREKIKDAPVP